MLHCVLRKLEYLDSGQSVVYSAMAKAVSNDDCWLFIALDVQICVLCGGQLGM